MQEHKPENLLPESIRYFNNLFGKGGSTPESVLFATLSVTRTEFFSKEGSLHKKEERKSENKIDKRVWVQKRKLMKFVGDNSFVSNEENT